MNTNSHALSKPLLTLLDTANFADEQTFQTAYQSVCEYRQKKVDSYRLLKDKFLSLGAGVLLERGLRNLGIADFSFSFGEHGKPYLADNSSVFFSLSHSGTLAACVFYHKEIGLDIQKIKSVSEKLIKKVTTQTEYDYLMSCDEEKRKTLFFRLWAAKESYLKYRGTGLSFSLKKLEVTFGETLTMKQEGNAVSAVFEEQSLDEYVLMFCHA